MPQKTSLIKYITVEQTPRMKYGKEQVLQPSLNKRRQEDHLPLVYLNPRQHLRGIPRYHHFDKYKCTISQEITGSYFNIMGAQLWKIGQETNDGSLIARLS